VNAIRREHPALQSNRSLRFHRTDNDALICWSKRTASGDDVVLCIVNLDPWNVQSGWIDLDLGALGVDPASPYTVDDLLTGARYQWHGGHNFIRLDPSAVPAHVFGVAPAGVTL
jgi:starch synthase (maltosyl-transferring)